MSLWLTKEELVELTGYKQIRSQKMALGQMNIPFRSRPADGYPLVDRWRFEGKIIRPQGRRREPNWGALDQYVNGQRPRSPK
jgi:hypothetical protein